MKRAVVMGVIVAGLIGFVGFVALRRSDRDGVRTGVWSGNTSQGLRIGRSWARRPGGVLLNRAGEPDRGCLRDGVA